MSASFSYVKTAFSSCYHHQSEKTWKVSRARLMIDPRPDQIWYNTSFMQQIFSNGWGTES